MIKRTPTNVVIYNYKTQSSTKMALKSFSTLSHNTLFHKLINASSSSPTLIPKSTSPSCIHDSHKQTPCFTKRELNLTLLLTPFLWSVLPNALLSAQELIMELQRYTDSNEGFTLQIPSSWTKVCQQLSVFFFIKERFLIIIYVVVSNRLIKLGPQHCFKTQIREVTTLVLW